MVVCVLFAVGSFAADEPKSSSKYGADFLKHWKKARDLTVAVAEAMPAENYDFKPNPEEMSFGDLVKDLRIAQQKTLRQFCLEHGHDPSNWSKIERGINTPPQDEKTLAR